jgi:SAM-dependent methyltransferase
MLRVDSCIICGGSDLERAPALVSPFVHRYVLDPDSRWSSPLEQLALCRCVECDVTFFDRRYEPDEVRALYRGYRGEEYLRSRRAVEPFYTRRLNEAIGSDPAVTNSRRTEVGRFFTAELGDSSVASVLDYGGDAGQFIPDLPGVERFVYEISDVEPIAGVTRVARLEDLPRRVDVVMLMHVLEHASDPLAMLAEVKAAARPDGWIYVEVPLDAPPALPSWAARAQRRFVASVGRSLRRTVIADVVSTPLRVVFRNRWLPGTFPKLHEHINFFSEPSLRRLAEAGGWEPVAPLRYRHGSGPMAVDALGLLARARPVTPAPSVIT